MSWNYRIVHQTGPYGDIYSIEEVYYDEDDTPYGYCSAAALDEELDGLKWTLEMMQSAFGKPVLEASELDGGESQVRMSKLGMEHHA